MKLLKLPPEKWKLIPHLPLPFTDDYECSNHGRIRDIRDGKILEGGRRGNREGWVRIMPARGTKLIKDRVSIFPHRMVWKLFGSPMPDGHHLYHLNGCRDDNYIWNLGTTNKRQHKRRVARLKKQGVYYHKRPRRYFHDRTKRK